MPELTLFGALYLLVFLGFVILIFVEIWYPTNKPLIVFSGVLSCLALIFATFSDPQWIAVLWFVVAIMRAQKVARLRRPSTR